MTKTVPVKQRVIDHLLKAGDRYETATEIARCIRAKLGTVASLLKMACDHEWMEREPGEGPRGGYGYKILYNPYKRSSYWTTCTDCCHLFDPEDLKSGYCPECAEKRFKIVRKSDEDARI